MIQIFLRAVGKFASALYLAGLAVFMGSALTRGSAVVTPDTLFRYELVLVVGLVVFQVGLFGKEIKGIIRK